MVSPDEALTTLMIYAEQFFNSLTPRERKLVVVGLRLSHGEEALARGEMLRAKEHLDAAAATIRNLRKG